MLLKSSMAIEAAGFWVFVGFLMRHGMVLFFTRAE